MNVDILGASWTVTAARAESRGLAPLERVQIDKIVSAVPGGAENIQEVCPLSPMQEGMLFHHLLNEQRDTYILSILFELQSQANVDVLVAAIQEVMNRHAALRTALLWEGMPQPLQIVYKQASLPVVQLTVAEDCDPLEQIKRHMKPGHDGLNLRHAPLMRLQIATHERATQHYALLQVHHLVCDHQSLRIVIAEVLAFVEGREHELKPPAPLQSAGGGTSKPGGALAAQAFFRAKLAGIDEPTAPFGMLNVHGDGSHIEEHCDVLDATLSRRIREQARRWSVSSARMFHAAWALVVARTTGRDDVVFGTVLLAGHQRSARAQPSVKMAVNTLPLRLKLRGLSARGLIEHTHRELAELLTHDEVPLVLAQSCSDVTGAAPLFTTLLNYRHSSLDLKCDPTASVSIRVLARGEAWTNYPISVTVDDLGEGFAVTEYADRPADLPRITAYLRTALTSLVDALERSPHQLAMTLPVLPSSEYHQVIEQMNVTDASYPREKLIHELFEDQVRATPDAVAVVYERQTLTYAELNGKANQLARYLLSRVVRHDQLVGICVERSLEMVVGLLGILKSGAAYVPLDPNYPHERLAYMLDDAAPCLLLTQEALRERLPSSQAVVVALDSDWDAVAAYGTLDIETRVGGLQPKHLAYVIYTSGSTGQPKGAMNEHRAVVNRLHWMQAQYNLGADDRVLQKTPFSFDVSVWEFFWPLMSGARLIVARPEGHKDPACLRELIEQHAITTLHFVPSMLQVFLESHRAGRCSSLKHVVCSGEELPASLQRKFFQLLPHAKLSNLYGPTEAAVDVTAWECRARDDNPRVPLGHPIANVRMYVLDSYLQPMPIGVPGEILIGGVGVGRGYWNRAVLTAERFIANPFSRDMQDRLYRTGDLGRWRADGAIEYLGRNDYQVKVRGFRIELGEIEAQLRSHTLIEEAAVLAHEDRAGEKQLAAYVVAKEAVVAAPSAEDLRAYLQGRLPEYMIPNAFIVIGQMPLTPNGKLDRRALPPPRPAEQGSHSESPRGESEQALAQIWHDLLQVEYVGRMDDFFDLGGNSLTAMRLAARIQSFFSVDVPLKLVFECKNVKHLAAYINDVRQSHLLDAVRSGGVQGEELLERIAAMSEREAQELLRDPAASGAS